jgi:hypothetical protein
MFRQMASQISIDCAHAGKGIPHERMALRTSMMEQLAITERSDGGF